MVYHMGSLASKRHAEKPRRNQHIHGRTEMEPYVCIHGSATASSKTIRQGNADNTGRTNVN